MIKRYHEAPLGIFEEVQKYTDGDYALVHLFEKNPRYLQAFQRAVQAGRDVILDNSIFELGTAFDGDKFAYWIEQLKPTWYIVPDSWKNSLETIAMFEAFTFKHPDLPGKKIGVAQGWTIDEVVYSYNYLISRCDMVAFNLDFSSIFYDSILPGCSREYKATLVPYCVAMSLGRYMVISKMKEMCVINECKPHHLLGCGVPQEVQWYPSSWNWIRSIDTCNPVMAGMHGRKYRPDVGITWKSPAKMCDHMDSFIKWEDRETIINNIKIMKEWCTSWKES